MDSAVEDGAKVFEVIAEEREALGFHFRTFLFAVPLLCCIVGFCKGLDCLPQSARKPRQWTGRGNHGNRSAAL